MLHTNKSASEYNPFSGSSGIGAPAPPYTEVTPIILKQDKFFKNYRPFQKPASFVIDTPFYRSAELSGLSGLQNNKPAARKNYAPSYYTDYNDPYAINSLADVLFNKAAQKKRYGDWVDFPLVGNIVASIIGGADLLWNQTFKPILGNALYGYQNKGLSGAVTGTGEGLKQAGINALVNLGETLDVISNPVKAVAIEGADALGLGDYGSKYNGNIGRGVVNALGFGSEGRVNYDWDTGNFFKDLLLETVSDPINWITFGSKAAIGSGAKTAMNTAIKEVAEESAESVSRKVAKQLTRAYIVSSDDAASVVSRFFAKNSNSVIRKTGQVFSNPYLNKMFNGVLDKKQAIKLADRVLEDVQQQVLKGVNQMRLGRNVYGFVDKLEASIFRSALYASGLGEAYQLGKKAAKTAVEPIIHKLNIIPDKIAYETYGTFKQRALQDPALSDTLGLFTIEYTDNLKKDIDKLQELYHYSAALSAVKGTDSLKAFTEQLGKAYQHAQLPMTPVTKFVYQKLTPLYKTGYLSNPGFPIRNTFDGLVRNATQMGGLEYLGKAADDFVRAMQDDKRYQTLLSQILEFGERGYYIKKWDLTTKKNVTVLIKSDVVNSDLINAFYKEFKPTELPIDVFKNYHRLVNDPSSVIGGMTTEVRELLQQGEQASKVVSLFEKTVLNNPEFENLLGYAQDLYYEAPNNSKLLITRLYKEFFDGKTSAHPSLVKRFLSDVISFIKLPTSVPQNIETFEKFLRAKYFIPNNPGMLSLLMDKNPILDVNEAVERCLRWSMYQQQRALGATHGEAIQKIIKTHFVYNNKPFALKLFETYFPFTGFTLKNFDYWAKLASKKSELAFADAAKKLNYNDWINLISDLQHAPKFSYKNRTLYAAQAENLAKSYLGDVPPLTGKQFVAHLKHFVQAHPDASTGKGFEAYIKSLKRPIKAGVTFNNIGNFMTPTLDFDKTANPELYNYAEMLRPKVFSLDAEHPYINISKGLQYQLLNGNIRYGTPVLDLSDTKKRKFLQSVFKLNPSWMDAVQFGSNPVESIYGRLLPVLSNTVERVQNPSKQKTNLDYLLDSVPILGTLMQRYTPVANRYQSTKNLSMLEPSIFGTVASFPQFSPTNPRADASEDLVKYWYGQYKGNQLADNPYDTYPQFSKVYQSASEKTAVEKALAVQYAIYKSLNLPEEYNPYQRFPHMAREAYKAQLNRYGTFNPADVDTNASEEAVRFWYKDYKQKNLPYAFNPYRYYPQYQKGTAYNTYKKTPIPKSIGNSLDYKALRRLYEGYYTDEKNKSSPMSTYYRQTKRLNRLARPRNFYRDLYTSTGYSRISLRLGKLNSKSLKYRVSDIRYAFKRHWYYFK